MEASDKSGGAGDERLAELPNLSPLLFSSFLFSPQADAVKIKIGYPISPNTTDASSVAKYYSDLSVGRKTYFGNQLNSATRLTRNEWSYVGRKLDPERWDMKISEVNAEYSPLG